MSDTSEAFTKFKRTWRLLTREEKGQFVTWSAGIIVMGLAIIGCFGFWGALFCLGLTMWEVGRRP